MSSYTRCPLCDTAFVVREEHLQIADGNVRCGSCKSVFNAREFMMDIPGTLNLIEEKEDTAKDITPTIKEEAEEAEEETQEETQEAEEADQQVPFMNESALTQNYEDPETIRVEGETEIEFISADDLNDEAVRIIQSDPEVSEINSDVEIDSHAEENGSVQAEMTIELPSKQSIEIELPEDTEMPIEDGVDIFADSLENIQLKEESPEAREAVVDNFIKPEDKPSRVLNKLIWAVGSLLLLLLIIGIIFWFKRFELALDQNWRPSIDEVCQYIECGIPVQGDINKIQLQKREVSYGKNNVTINMLLFNAAKFKQAYPNVEVVFSDLDGNVLSTHLVLPSEYLRTDLIGSLMPKNVAVHIEFKLDVDTKKAVGYEFKFL